MPRSVFLQRNLFLDKLEPKLQAPKIVEGVAEKIATTLFGLISKKYKNSIRNHFAYLFELEEHSKSQ